MKKIILLIVALLSLGIVYFWPTPISETPEQKPASNSVAATTAHEFREIGITMNIPDNLEVIKNSVFNPDTPQELESYIFYIQDYTKAGAIDFQIYGLYQVSTPAITWEQLSEVKNDTTTYKYVKEIEINGLKGFETQLNGERGNYVYLFHLNGRVLRVAVSPATEQYRQATDEIIGTIKSKPSDGLTY